MMTNPLREVYKKGKRWCERGLANLGRETESDKWEQKKREIGKEKEAQYIASRLYGKHTEGDKIQVGSQTPSFGLLG